MISKTDKKRIKKIIGVRYVAEVQSRLKEKEVLNKQGNEHSASFITNVMNGQPHKIIEDTIYEIVSEKKAEILKRKQLLSIQNKSTVE